MHSPRYVYSPGTGLWMPTHPEMPEFVPMALGEVPESLIKQFKYWPTAKDFSTGLVSSLDAANSDSAIMLSALECPVVAASVRGLTAAVEATAGRALTDLVKMGTGLNIDLNGVVSALFNGDLDVVIQAISKAVADSVAQSLNCVPILGTFISAVFEVVSAIAGFGGKSDADLERIAIDQLNRNLKDSCGAQVKKAIQLSETTASKGVLPSDLFRPVALAYQRGERLPLCLASMYVALCGGVTGGFGFKNEKEYQEVTKWVDRPDWRWAKAVEDSRLPIKRWVMEYSKKRPLGIPIEIRRKMWTVIKGIMNSVTQPGLTRDLSRPGDGGQALMPFLQETIRSQITKGHLGEWVPVAGGDPFFRTDFLRAHSRFICAQYGDMGGVSGTGDRKVWIRGNCAGYNSYNIHHLKMGAEVEFCDSGDCQHWNRSIGEPVNLTGIFYESIDSWQNQLIENYWNTKLGKWDLAKAGLAPSVKKSTAMLTIGNKTASKLHKAVKKDLSPTKPWQTAVGAAGVAGAGAIAWVGTKHLLPLLVK